MGARVPHVPALGRHGAEAHRPVHVLRGVGGVRDDDHRPCALGAAVGDTVVDERGGKAPMTIGGLDEDVFDLAETVHLPGRGHAASRPIDAVPIWLAALNATACKARGNGQNRIVHWNWVSGRALYTNAGANAERIEPLGVSLKGGHTVAVHWMPGETAYTVEVYQQSELCA